MGHWHLSQHLFANVNLDLDIRQYLCGVVVYTLTCIINTFVQCAEPVKIQCQKKILRSKPPPKWQMGD